MNCSAQDDGNTSMHLAALEGNIDAFVVLLAHGADFTIKNEEGKTCFDLLKSAKDKLTILSKTELNLSLLEAHDNALWFLVVQEDGTSDIDLFAILSAKVNTLVSNHTSLAAAKDANNRAAVDVASKPIRKVIESVIFFCGQYSIHHGPPLHMSATAVVVFADDFRVDAIYEKAFNEVVKTTGGTMDQHAFKKALEALSVQGFGGAAELLAAAVAKNDGLVGNFKHCDKDNDGSIEMDEFLEYCGNMMGRSRRVAIKFMKNKEQYEREQSMRENLEPRYIVNLLPSPDPVTIAKAVTTLCLKISRDKELSLKDYEYCIVMPAADRTLDAIFRFERPDINLVRALMKDVAEALQHLHKNNIIHGDLKMLNILRVDGHMRLIDLDAACHLKTPVGCKFSSGVLPPEMIASLTAKQSEEFTSYWKRVLSKNPQLTSADELWEKIKPRLADGQLIVVKTFATVDDDKPIRNGLPYLLVDASVAIDVWAFGVLLYCLVSGSPLLSVNRDEDLLEGAFARILEWSHHGMLEKMIEAQIRPKDSSAADLLLHLLHPDPALRWDIASVLKSEFIVQGVGGDSGSSGTMQVVLRKLSAITKGVAEVNQNVVKVLVKLDKISDQIEDVLECQRRGFEAILQQAERFHKEDKDYFKAQDAKLNAQFELLNTINGKIDGLSDHLAKGFLKVEATFDRVTATITAELFASGEKQTKMMAEFDAFHDKLSKMTVSAFDKDAIKEMMKDSMSTMGKEIKQQLEDSMAQVMDRATGSDKDPTQKDKLDHLIEMFASTKEQIDGMKKGVEDLSQLVTGSAQKYIMPRTFILVPVGNEPEPVSTRAPATAPEEKKKSRFGLPDLGFTKAIVTDGATAAIGVVGQNVVGLLMGKGKEVLKRACRGAYRLCWKKLRVQFICPVTMQPVGPEGCVITMPTDFLIYSAKALKYGMIILKIAMATQGLGGVVPDLSGIIPVNLGMDIKQFASEYTELHSEATTIQEKLIPKTSTHEDQVLAAAEGDLDDKAKNEVARLRSKFTEQFTGMADGDGTTAILAIYKLIAEGRNQTLKSAQESTWQPKDDKGKAWGMELAIPSDGTPGQMIWASEEGATRLRSNEGMKALNPEADVNRNTAKGSSTATDLVMRATENTAYALAKTAGINLVAIKQRCAEKYGISPEAVMSVVTSPIFTQIVLDVASGKKDKAAKASDELVLDEMQVSSGLSRDQLSALRDLLLSGGNDWTSLENLAAAALDKSGVFGAKALWALAKQAKSLKIVAIERRAEEHGLKPGEVETLFLAAASDSVFVAAIQALINNQPGAAKVTLEGSAVDALVASVADKTGLLQAKVKAVVTALLTMDLTALEALVSVSVKPLVSPRGAGKVAGLRDEVESLKEKEGMMQAALQQKDETMQLLRSQLEEAKQVANTNCFGFKR